MNEGWHEDEHFILFDQTEVGAVQRRYSVAEYLPGFQVLGLRGWDDFIVRNETGELFTIPTVPLDSRYLKPLARIPPPARLEPDEQFAGKIKWYVKPIVFGGDPSVSDNLIWVDHDTHGDLVCFWNEKYVSATSQTTPPN